MKGVNRRGRGCPVRGPTYPPTRAACGTVAPEERSRCGTRRDASTELPLCSPAPSSALLLWETKISTSHLNLPRDGPCTVDRVRVRTGGGMPSDHPVCRCLGPEQRLRRRPKRVLDEIPFCVRRPFRALKWTSLPTVLAEWS